MRLLDELGKITMNTNARYYRPNTRAYAFLSRGMDFNRSSINCYYCGNNDFIADDWQKDEEYHTNGLTNG